MLKNTFLLCLFYFVNSFLIAQTNHPYLGETPPSNVPSVFAKGTISLEGRYEFGSVFSKDTTEFYFGLNHNGKAEIRCSKFIDGAWTAPETVISSTSASFNDPMLSPDQQRLYYISDKSKTGEGTGDYDIWYSERQAKGWSQPINAGPMINSPKDEYYISFTSVGTMYYGSNKHTGADDSQNFDIYTSQFVNGAFQESIRLGGGVNTDAYEADVFVAPDESYLIFCSQRTNGLGRGDLYISYQQENGEWSNATPLKEGINTSAHELCPWVTGDGKYFLYTSNQDIYWVSTEAFKE